MDKKGFRNKLYSLESIHRNLKYNFDLKKIVIFAETVCIYNVNPHAFFLASTLRFKDNLRFTQKIPH